MTQEIIIILLLVLANGFFSGAEIAVIALRRTRIEELAEQGRRTARAVLALRDQPERFLATVQVGITVVSATAAAFGGASIAARIAPELARISWIGHHSQGVALALVVALVSYLSIVVGELVPKSLALRSAERYALLVARPLLALSWLAKPVVWLLSKSANVLLKPFGDQTTFTETRHSADEVQEVVESAAKAGTIDAEAGEIASRALELPDLTVADIMVPRQAVVAIPRHAPLEELQHILLEHSHTRLPVYDGSIDNVIGYVNVKDLLALVWERKLIVLEDLTRAAFFVPASKRSMDLLKEMRQRHLPFAIVVDEHGGMAGVVTMEDLLEELVGEIFSEHDAAPPELICVQPDGSAVIDGAAPVREINRSLSIELPEDGAWTTLAGLCIAVFGRMPATGESVTLDNGVALDVLEASPRRIQSVRVRPPPPPPAEVEGA